MAILILSISIAAVLLIWSTSKEQGALVSQPISHTTRILISVVLNMGARLGKMVKGMAYALGDIPVTVKMRTGVKDNVPTAHKLFPKTHGWGAGAVAVSNEGLWTVLMLILLYQLHGRSRQQRYSREADWTYIKGCVSKLREFEEQNGLPKMPFWGNGDCYSWQQYDECMRASGVDGILIGRGGLIKPWIL